MNSVRAIFWLLLVAAFAGITYWWSWRNDEERRQTKRETLRKEIRCGECGYDVRSGHERCPACGAPVVRLDASRLENERPAQPIVPRKLRPGELAVVLHVAYNIEESRTLIEQLLTRGIMAWDRRKSLPGKQYSEYACTILVGEDDREAAQTIGDYFRINPPTK